MDKKIINTQTVEILRKWAIGRDLRERKSIVKVEYIKFSDWNDDPIHFSGDDNYILIKNKKRYMTSITLKLQNIGLFLNSMVLIWKFSLMTKESLVLLLRI